MHKTIIDPMPDESRPAPLRLHSIGYQRSRGPEQVAERLAVAGITLVLDVRKRPRSQRPGYDRAGLEAAISAAGLRYVWVERLGNPPSLRDEWDDDPDLARRMLAGHLEERHGPVLDRLAEVLVDEHVAIMCRCPEHEHCHRRVVAERIATRVPGLELVLLHP